jgi:hypothetical protein
MIIELGNFCIAASNDAMIEERLNPARELS